MTYLPSDLTSGPDLAWHGLATVYDSVANSTPHPLSSGLQILARPGEQLIRPAGRDAFVIRRGDAGFADSYVLPEHATGITLGLNEMALEWRPSANPRRTKFSVLKEADFRETYPGEEFDEANSSALAKVDPRLEGEAVDGDDSRRMIGDTTAVPFRWICSLELYFEEPHYLRRGVDRYKLGRKASGVLIGPSCVLTAAHNLWYKDNIGKWCKFGYIKVTPGRNLESKPFGTTLATDWKTSKQWSPSLMGPQKPPSPWDFAIIKLKSPIGEKKVSGRRLGWWGSDRWGHGTKIMPTKLNWLRKNRSILRNAGYPLAACGRNLVSNREWVKCSRHTQRRWAATQWYARSRVIDAEPIPGLLLHSIDTSSGHSGSPVWYYYRDRKTGLKRRWLVGIHTGMIGLTGSLRSENQAVLIRPKVLQEISQLRKQMR